MVKRTCLGQARLPAGQAVLEFAIFASFLLLCMGIFIQTGIYTRFSDNLRMTAFRRTVRLAQTAGATNSSASPYVSAAVIKDQFIPSPGRHFGAADTTAVSASYSPVVTTRMRQLPGPAAYVNQVGLPLLYLDINSTPSSPNVIQYRFARYSVLYDVGSCVGFRVRKDVAGITGGPAGPWWEWVNDTKCGAANECYASTKKSDGDYYIDSNNPVWADADADGVYETPLNVISAERSHECPNEPCIFKSIVFLDPRFGDINSHIVTVNPTTGIEEGQGLQQTYTKIRNSNNSVNRQETPSGITTRGSINNQITVRRNVTLTNGSSHEWDSTVNQNIQENF